LEFFPPIFPQIPIKHQKECH